MARSGGSHLICDGRFRDKADLHGRMASRPSRKRGESEQGERTDAGRAENVTGQLVEQLVRLREKLARPVRFTAAAAG
jgi:hypothetical protein